MRLTQEQLAQQKYASPEVKAEHDAMVKRVQQKLAAAPKVEFKAGDMFVRETNSKRTDGKIAHLVVRAEVTEVNQYGEASYVVREVLESENVYGTPADQIGNTGKFSIKHVALLKIRKV